MQQKRYHIIIDISHVDNEVLSDEQGLEQFLRGFPEAIGMHVLKGPMVAVGVPENPGITGVVIIDYSHISVHTFTEYGDALVDVFSCKPFDQESAVQAVLGYFKAPRENARIKEVYWG
jgi:S-adenosylmethionine decarboxylase